MYSWKYIINSRIIVFQDFNVTIVWYAQFCKTEDIGGMFKALRCDSNRNIKPWLLVQRDAYHHNTVQLLASNGTEEYREKGTYINEYTQY